MRRALRIIPQTQTARQAVRRSASPQRLVARSPGANRTWECPGSRLGGDKAGRNADASWRSRTRDEAGFDVFGEWATGAPGHQ